MRRAFTIGMFVAIFAAVPALAEADVPVKRTRSALRTYTQNADTTRRAVTKTQADQATLEHRITALKRLAAENRLTDRSELERLLRESVAANRVLDARRAEAKKARADLTRWARDTIRNIDAEVKQRAPDMKRGSLANRKKAARHIGALMKLRKELQASLRAPAAPTAPTNWSKYVDVKIDPLDGPTELGEKADFIEDTRDKYEKKRRAILRLLSDAKREAEIRRAAAEFRDDRSIFDDDSRSVRVQRSAVASAGGQNRATTTAETADQPASFNAQAGTNQQQTSNDVPLNGLASPPTDDSTARESSPPPAADPSTKVGGGTAAPTAATPTPAANPATRTVDAQTLIGLKIDQLGASDLDPATLQRLLKELTQLDKHLADQAKKMRDRAAALESDEARALDKK